MVANGYSRHQKIVEKTLTNFGYTDIIVEENYALAYDGEDESVVHSVYWKFEDSFEDPTLPELVRHEEWTIEHLQVMPDEPFVNISMDYLQFVIVADNRAMVKHGINYPGTII